MKMKKKCVLLVGNHLSQSGQNRSVGEELAIRLNQHSWKTILVSRKLNKPTRLWDMLWTIIKLRKFYTIAEVDVFSGPAFIWAFLCAGLLKLQDKPLVLILHGGNLPEYALRYPRRVKRLVTWADTVVAPSSYLKQKLAIYRADIQIIPNGLEINQFPYRLVEIPKFKLVWLRAFHQIYNPSLAPKVIKILKDQKLDFCLVMVGPDKGDGCLQAMLRTAQELDVSDRIEIVRGVRKKQVPEMLAQGDIFLNTTNFDNTPVSVIEAMASGCCIVSTNIGGIPHLLEDGVDALLVPPDDPDAMAKAVRRILTEPGFAKYLSQNARRKAEQFDWSVILPQWEALFSEVINRHGRRHS